MKYRVMYTPLAKEDLKTIYRYLAKNRKEPQIAAKLVNRIRESIRSLNEMPERYVRVEWEPWKSRNVRHYAVGNYEVFYEVNSQEAAVMIYRIFYGGRNIEAIIASEENA
ncbi:type II toxin-antitoxin system RelE/ParE family toxin [Ruminococcus sp.]|uniref:type II toxin-antitoxin system RelE/ParE family toxin n=1 Tax=Ruminococcus sp. TaxID=41978 RepID=UPI0025FDC7A4|nr:type II toxin-antitoxin system RelE/ParE family toxin [Ruminococcus sp.]